MPQLRKNPSPSLSSATLCSCQLNGRVHEGQQLWPEVPDITQLCLAKNERAQAQGNEKREPIEVFQSSLRKWLQALAENQGHLGTGCW